MSIRMYVDDREDLMLLRMPTSALCNRLRDLGQELVDNDDPDMPNYCCNTFKAKVCDVKTAIRYVCDNNSPSDWYQGDDTIESYYSHVIDHMRGMDDDEYLYYVLG